MVVLERSQWALIANCLKDDRFHLEAKLEMALLRKAPMDEQEECLQELEAITNLLNRIGIDGSKAYLEGVQAGMDPTRATPLPGTTRRVNVPVEPSISDASRDA